MAGSGGTSLRAWIQVPLRAGRGVGAGAGAPAGAGAAAGVLCLANGLGRAFSPSSFGAEIWAQAARAAVSRAAASAPRNDFAKTYASSRQGAAARWRGLPAETRPLGEISASAW